MRWLPEASGERLSLTNVAHRIGNICRLEARNAALEATHDQEKDSIGAQRRMAWNLQIDL
jgi:hypothetical protein